MPTLGHPFEAITSHKAQTQNYFSNVFFSLWRYIYITEQISKVICFSEHPNVLQADEELLLDKVPLGYTRNLLWVWWV